MPTLVPPSGEQYLILNFYATKVVCLNYCYHIYQNLWNFTYAFKCYYQKCKLASLSLGYAVNV